MRRLYGLEGNWAGDVHSADGTLVGREQISCAWDAERTAFRVTSCRVSCTGRVLEAEQAQLIYDPRTDSIAALLRAESGRTELARAYSNDQNELVLVSDGALRLHRFSCAFGGDSAVPARDTWHHRMEVATGGRLAAEWQAVLYRV
jgi:hypothetical protein